MQMKALLADGQPEALDLIRRHEDPSVRLALVDAIEEARDERFVPVLLDMAARDPSRRVKVEALDALGEYRSPEILLTLLNEAARPSHSRRVRQIVTEQLKSYDSEEAVDALLDLLEDDDAYVQQRAIESLYALNRHRLKPIWKLIARDWEGTSWEGIARQALEALEGLPDPVPDEILAEKLRSVEAEEGSSGPELRRRAVRRLLFLNPPDLPERIITRCGDEDARVREAAVGALKRIDGAHAIPVLILRARTDPDERVRSAAIGALCSHPSSEVLSFLLDQLSSRASLHPHVRSLLALGLSSYDTEESIQALRTLVRDEDPQVRATAVDALVELNRPDFEDVWQSLKGEGGSIGRTAREALEALRGRRTS